MVWRLILISWALAALSIAAFYWFGPEPPPPEPEPEPAPVVAAPEPAKPPPPPKPRAPDPGPMVVVVGHRHIARLDERGWTTSPEAQFVFGLQFGPDGGVWTGDHEASFRRHGDATPFTAISVPPEADRDGCMAFLPTAAPALWIACRNTVHVHQNDTWTVDGPSRPSDDRPLEGYGRTPELPVALAQDARGRLWLARRGRLEIRHAMGGWNDVAVPGEAELVALAPGPGGSMYVLTREALLNYPDYRRATKIDLPTEGAPRHERLAVSDRGNIVVLSQEELDLAYTQTLGGGAPMDSQFDWVALTRTTDGEARRYTDAGDISLGRAEGIAIDDDGRVWWTSAAGLAIVDKDNIRRWWRGAVPELLNDTGTGVGALTEIVVAAGGPQLPTVDEATPTPVRGRVLRAKSGLKLQICRAPRARYRRTPCQDQRLHFEATTDARGGFTIADVPPGEYGVVIERDGQWANTRTYFFVGKVGKKPVVVPAIDLRRVSW